MRVLAQDAAREQAFADGARARERRVDLDADQEALAAHLDDCGVIDRAQLGEQFVAANCATMPAKTAKPSQWLRRKARKQPSRVRVRINVKCQAPVAAATTRPAKYGQP